MGRMLGAFDEDNNLDRPDLNKCPDCGCFFAGNNCPICGKECPEEYRAGNRKPEKKKKDRMPRGAVFVDWYHRWWFIAIMLVIMPIVGIILLVTSPHEKWKKILFSAVAVVVVLLNTFGFTHIYNIITNAFDQPVNTSLTREEYLARCESVSPEDFYRQADDHDGGFVTMTLTVDERIIDYSGYYEGDKYTTYYICSDENGGKFRIMIRDCLQNSGVNLIAGDVITVYGEGAGTVTVEDGDYNAHTHPCINVAYIVRK